MTSQPTQQEINPAILAFTSQAEDDANIGLFEFMQCLHLPIVPVFCEGEDDAPFYTVNLRASIANFRIFVCNGKKWVIDAQNKIRLHSDTKQRLAFFFVDRDYDDFYANNPTSSEIFITDGYSIENYLCHSDTVWNYLNYQHKNISNYLTRADFNRKFDALLVKAEQELLNFSALAMRRKKEGYRNVNLNKFHPSDEYSFCLQNGLQKNNAVHIIDTFCTRVQVAKPHPSENLNNEITWMNSLPMMQRCRGKWLLGYVLCMIGAIEKQNKIKKKDSNISKVTAVSRLAIWLQSIPSIDSYITAMRAIYP